MKKTLVSSVFELDELLKAKLGKDIETDAFSKLIGCLIGTYKGEPFNITFVRNECLLISISKNGKALLEQIQPILSGAMGSNPICSYDLQCEGIEGKDPEPTIEWDIKDPESRIKEVVNGRAFSKNAKLYKLKLFGDRKIETYIENEKQKLDRIANARIYGIDKGSINDVKEINNLNETDLFFNIDAMGGHIWRCKHEMSHGRIPQIDLTEELYAIEYMVYQTKKFGVELDEPQIDQHIIPTPSYLAWFRFYDNHFKKNLTNEQWNVFQKAQREGKDVSAFMPTGNWQDTLEKPVTKSLNK